MKNCSQNTDQSVYDHGVSVRDFDSQSFKIKYKQIDRNGKAICNKLFITEK